MIINADVIARLLSSPDPDDPLIITPQPSLEGLAASGAAAVDLRLGTWIVSLRQSKIPMLDVSNSSNTLGEAGLTRQYYVPFGKKFILHPKYFVLGVTLEWIRLPRNMAGYVIGKSSWGRRGLVIATAVGVHPGFAGCLTLEISNLGEIPVAIWPVMHICQLFVHDARSESPTASKSVFGGQRKPRLGTIKPDPIAEALMKANQ